MAERITSYKMAKQLEQEAMEILYEVRRYAATEKDKETDPTWRKGLSDWHARLNAAMIAIDEGWAEEAVIENEVAIERAIALQHQLTPKKREE